MYIRLNLTTSLIFEVVLKMSKPNNRYQHGDEGKLKSFAVHYCLEQQFEDDFEPDEVVGEQNGAWATER